MDKKEAFETIKKYHDLGIGFAEIAQKLNTQGIKTARNKSFSQSSARYLLVKGQEERASRKRLEIANTRASQAAATDPIVLSAGDPIGQFNREQADRLRAHADKRPMSLTPKAPTEEKFELVAAILKMKDIPVAKRADIALTLILY